MSHLVSMRLAIITESFPPDVNGVAHCVLCVAELLTGYATNRSSSHRGRRAR
jgi:hypothetical protein